MGNLLQSSMAMGTPPVTNYFLIKISIGLFRILPIAVFDCQRVITGPLILWCLRCFKICMGVSESQLGGPRPWQCFKFKGLKYDVQLDFALQCPIFRQPKRNGEMEHHIWLVALTILKNISQLGWLFPIYGKNVPNHQPVSYIYNYIYNFQIPAKWTKAIQMLVNRGQLFCSVIAFAPAFASAGEPSFCLACHLAGPMMMSD